MLFVGYYNKIVDRFGTGSAADQDGHKKTTWPGRLNRIGTHYTPNANAAINVRTKLATNRQVKIADGGLSRDIAAALWIAETKRRAIARLDRR